MKAILEGLPEGGQDWMLATAIDPTRLPRHVAVIMDGNGRWARKRGLPRVAGHRAGVEAVRATVETCARMGVEVLTLYAFSLENWKRPRTEVDALWQLLRHYLRSEVGELHANNVRFDAIGRLDGLSRLVRRELDEARSATEHNTGLRLNLAINYGGRAELADAVNAILDEARRTGTIDTLQVTEEQIAARLYTAGLPDPDLLVRTSGELRVSNFLLWQIAYAELYVTDTLWPDFRQADLLQAVLSYQQRDRRFGGLTAEAPRENWMSLLGAALR